jgi:hypothetical protein
VIFVMIKVPKDLSGASLLGVHNWVKGNIARTNPGASPDYTITDTKGDRLTLSDVARNAGRDVNIEVTTVGSVRTNPPSNLTMIPGMDILYPNMTRGGNNLSDLLPDEIDSAMATRIVAEQGLHRGLHTLNRMSLTQYNKQISSPTTAALLQMGELIMKNPSDRTPFTQRTPLQYGSEKALQQWLVETSGATEKTISVANTEVEDAKIHAKYGLNTQDITKFAQEVLSDYLMVASSNRGLIRTIIRNTADLRDNRNAAVNRETIQKLSYMFPTQPSSFYEGTQRAFAARTPFMYPAYAESILTDKEMRRVVEFARGYPRNMGTSNTVPKPMKKLTENRKVRPWQDFRGFLTQTYQMIKRKTRDGNDDALEANYDREGYLQTIITALGADPTIQFEDRKKYRPFLYYEDLGGFYPSPPPKWPRKLMYAIMDGFLENLPHIINMEDPSNSNLTPVQMAYFSKPEVVTEIVIPGHPQSDNKETTLTTAEAIAIASTGTVPVLSTLAELDDFMALPGVLKIVPAAKQPTVFPTPVEQDEYRDWLINAVNTTVRNLGTIDLNLGEAKSRLTFEAGGPKSILEMVYDIAEIATSKYDYNMRGDDFKFTMSVVHYSFEALKQTTQGTAFGIGQRINSGLRKIIGGDRSRRLQELLDSVGTNEFDEDVQADFTQRIFIAQLMEIRDTQKAQLTGTISDTAKAQLILLLREEHSALIEAINGQRDTGNLNQQFLTAAQTLMSEMLDNIEKGGA